MRAKLFFTMLLVVVLSVVTADAANSVVVDVKPVTVEMLLAADDVSDLEDILYPSGLSLPTNYIDFYMFADVGDESITVSDTTYEFLLENFPSADGLYTWAEYYSAQVYMCWVGTLLGGQRASTDEDVVALQEMLQSCGLSIAPEQLTCTKLTDIAYLQQYIERFKEALENESSAQYHELKTYDLTDGVSLTMGKAYMSTCTDYNVPIGLDVQNILKWLDTRIDYMNMFGIVTDAAEPVKVSGFQSSTESNEQSSSDYVGSIQYVAAPLNIGQRRMGLQDIALVVSLVVVICAVVVFWVVDFIRKRNDPLRRWRRW